MLHSLCARTRDNRNGSRKVLTANRARARETIEGGALQSLEGIEAGNLPFPHAQKKFSHTKLIKSANDL